MEGSNMKLTDNMIEEIFGKEVEASGVCEKHGPWRYMTREKQPMKFRVCKQCQADEKADKERADSEAKAAAAKQRRIDELIECGVSLRHMDRTFDSFIAETSEQSGALTRAKALAEAVAKSPKNAPSLILCGRPGTGKSHLACAITIAVFDAGQNAFRASIADIIREFKDSWRKESEHDEIKLLRWYGGISLLIIEEIGVQFGSDTERMYLFEIINRRYENCLPTVLVSNLDPEKLAAEVGERVMDRLREDGGRLVRFTGESWRKK